MAIFLRALVVAVILIVASRVVAEGQTPPGDEAESYWIEKIELEQRRAEKARVEIVRLEAEISKAKRRRYPRGTALREKFDELEAARETSTQTDSLIPELIDRARRAGVSPGALRQLNHEAGAERPSPAATP